MMLTRIFVFLTLLFSFLPFTFAKEPIWNTLPIEFSVFEREDCAHCIALKQFLTSNFPNASGVKPKYYDIDLAENKALFDAFTTENQLPKVTPIILIGNEIITGFQSDRTTGQTIQALTRDLKKSSFFENFGKASQEIEAGGACEVTSSCLLPTAKPSGLVVELPYFGLVDLRNYSILFLSIILGFVDGFNPCALWVLVMFLSILANTGSRKKMVQIAGIFILAEAVMYYMILNVWYKTWDFIKLDSFITPAIGVLSLGAGAYFLYEFFSSKDNECKVISSNQKKKTIDRIKEIASKPMSIGVFFLTIAIAFSVNIVEFACSIGIPQAYTKLLELSDLSLWAKQWYLALYTLFYMVDDFVVFGVAIYAIGYLHITTKYTRYCLVVGGVIMLILGYFFLFDPTALKMIVS